MADLKALLKDAYYRAGPVQPQPQSQSQAQPQQERDLVFSDGSTAKNWTTPVHHESHWYPQLEFRNRNRRMLATQVFHERETQRVFRYRSIALARDRMALNPTWVEALMGFPADWTRLDDDESLPSTVKKCN